MRIVDDILDVTKSSEELGKTAGKDMASDKTTYPKLLGLEKSRGCILMQGNNFFQDLIKRRQHHFYTWPIILPIDRTEVRWEQEELLAL
uniref:Uncharacterized protein n=1 Tax=Oryza meridionalis TaxID=40149 RepID=A0A0E0DNJ2_9ORYZ